jgi:KaiC/GvpD/RAD55 family RecA-like ATPase
MAYSLARAATLASETGQPLPHVPGLIDLYANGNEIYRGALTMVAGLPGGRKTAFGLAFAEGVNSPALYFSADSDAATVTSRLIAMHERNVSASQIRREMNDDDYAKIHYSGLAAEYDSKIEFCFDPDPDLADIHDEIDAWVERYDDYPALIVCDNLLDIFHGGEDDVSGFKAVLKGLKTLARETNAAVLVLHHMRELDGTDRNPIDPGKPAPRKALQGRPSQTPAAIISVAAEVDQFHTAWVKDRNAADDPLANNYATYRMDADHNVFEPWRSLAGTPMPREGWSPSAMGD